MKSLGLAAMIAAIALISCSDEQASKELTAPATPGPAVAAPSPNFSASALSSSSICQTYQTQLAAADSALNATPDDESAQATQTSLSAIVADVCN